MGHYKQIEKDIGEVFRFAAILARVRAELRPGDLAVFDILVEQPPHRNERELAELVGEPHRTFKLKKARIIAAIKKNLD